MPVSCNSVSTVEDVVPGADDDTSAAMPETSGAAAEIWKARLERARAPIEAKQAAHEADLQDLSARWDALGPDCGADGCERQAILGSLRDCVLERNYITNLLEGIERELNA